MLCAIILGEDFTRPQPQMNIYKQLIAGNKRTAFLKGLPLRLFNPMGIYTSVN